MRDKKVRYFMAAFVALGLILIMLLSYNATKESEKTEDNTAVLKNISMDIEKEKTAQYIHMNESVEKIKTDVESIEHKIERVVEEEVPTYTSMYATCRLNIRTNSSTDSNIYTTVNPNTELKILDGFDMNGWKSVLYNNEKLYVYGKYLSKDKVIIRKKPVQQSNKRKSGNVKQTSSSVNGRLIGRFKITHYAGDTATSTGAIPTVGRTIAVDPRVIPYGSRVVINGHTYIAEDCGGAIKGNKIDIFVGSESEAYQKGVYHTNVYWG